MRDEELRLIYKMIGAYGFSTVKELLDKYEETQAEKQELIEYLKEQKSNLHWEMSELNLGMCDTKIQEGKLTAYEEILNKIEKR